MEDNIMDLDVTNLANKQYEYLKKHSIKILETIIDNLNNDKLQDIYDMLIFSSSGDGWGSENYYINFSYNNEPMDIEEIIHKMAKLKNIKLDE
jgi:hypothetical protein